jgi:hypothetical protein
MIIRGGKIFLLLFSIFVFCVPFVGADTMVVLQAHNDDFDISLSGLSLEYDDVIIFTITDVGRGHYDQAVSHGLIVPDLLENATNYSPSGKIWNSTVHSDNLSKFRLGTMNERYDRYNWTSYVIGFPDFMGEDCPSSLQEEYLIFAGVAICDMLDNLSDIDLYIHDPFCCEHMDHRFTGRIGAYVYRRVDIDQLFYYYVYTDCPLKDGYFEILVDTDFKLELFSEIWELQFLPLEEWRKNPCGDDYYFKHEIVREISLDVVGGELDDCEIFPRYFVLFVVLLIFFVKNWS